MICDDAYLSSKLDTPDLQGSSEHIFMPNDDVVVTYHCSDDQKCWNKSIALEQCGRTDLNYLLNFISSLQSISPYRFASSVPCDDSPDFRDNVHCGLFLPRSVTLSGTNLTLSYPFSKFGSVCSLLRPYYVDGGLPEPIVAAIFARAVRGLAQLHKAGWIHRSLCARHLLIYKPPSSSWDEDLDVAFCGLGSLARVRPSGSCLNRTDLPVVEACWRGWRTQNLQEGAYTTHPSAWYSPEVIAQDFEGYGCPSDVYSLGLTLAELHTGIAPFVGTITPSLIFLKKMTLREPLELPCAPGQSASAEMLEVFAQCTAFDASARATAAALLQHPWVRRGLATPLTDARLAPLRAP